MINLIAGSISRRIQACLIGVYVVTYVATSAIVYEGARESLLDSSITTQHQLAEIKYQQLVNIVSAFATDLTAWSELEVMNDIISGDVDKRVDQTLENLKSVYNPDGEIYAFDESGKLVARSGDDDAQSGPTTIPQEWVPRANTLTLTGKSTDPSRGGDIIALEIPVSAGFDKNYHTGTLVMTYPWSALEKQVFSRESGTMLLDRESRIRRLAADRADADRIPLESDIATADFIVGRSTPQPGLLSHWQILTWQDTNTVTHALRRIVGALLLLGVFLGIPITIIGRWLSYRLTAPVAELTQAAQEIAETEKLDALVPISSSDELGTLAQSFNRMIASLDSAKREREKVLLQLAELNQTLEAKIAARTHDLEIAIEAQRRLIADISHEIKSPLARLSAALGLARRPSESYASRQFDRMEIEVRNIAALASELLTLARLSGTGTSPEFTRIELSALVARVVADAIYETPARASDIFLSGPDDPVSIMGNGELLRRAVENVIRNAIFYTAEKTPIEVVIRHAEPDMIVIDIRDRGPGVPQAALAHLFEPFYRVDEARTRDTGGSGIGLAICQRAIQLHGGTVLAKINTPRGLIVEMTIPSHPPTMD